MPGKKNLDYKRVFDRFFGGGNTFFIKMQSDIISSVKESYTSRVSERLDSLAYLNSSR